MNFLYRAPLHKLPIPVRCGVDGSQPEIPLMLLQHLRQIDVQQMVGCNGDIEWQQVVQDPVCPHESGGQYKVTNILMVPESTAVPDHDNRIRPQYSHMIGNRLGIGRPHSDVDQAESAVAGPNMVVGGHLHSSVRGYTVGKQITEHLHMHIVVGEDDVPLKILYRRTGVVVQPDRKST